MTSVLAIDAAWTCNEPSGIALLDDGSGAWTCVALAPSYDSFVQRAEGVPADWEQQSIRGCHPNLQHLLGAAQLLLGGRQPDLITLDMPVATVPITGRRAADDQISVTYGARHCPAHTPSSTRPGPLGAALTSSLASNGYQLVTNGAPARATKRVIEVYPHPALLTLLNRPTRVPYKVSKSNKYWPRTPIPTRISNLLEQFRQIHEALAAEISEIRLPLPAAGQVKTLSYLKRFEDALDALVCGWSGIKYLGSQATPYGDHTAAIWVP